MLKRGFAAAACGLAVGFIVGLADAAVGQESRPGAGGSGPAPGTPAPRVALRKLDGKGEVIIPAEGAKRPVVLVFGSWT